MKDVIAATTFRAWLLLTFVVAASVAAFLYLSSWTASGFLDQQVAPTIEADLGGLVDVYEATGMIGLANSINRRANPSANRDGVYLLQNAMGVAIAGNVRAWPTKVENKNGLLDFTLSDLRASTRVAAVRAKQYLLPGGGRLLVGRDIRDNRLAGRLYLSLVIGLAAVIIVGASGGFIFGRAVASAKVE